MELFATLALAGYPVLVVGLFMMLKPIDAVIWTCLLAWLYLPLTELTFPGIPNYGKFTASSIVILPCIFAFDPSRFFQWKFKWLDIALLTWIFSPMASSLANGLGAYDGLSGMSREFLTYGVPYIAGSLYLNNLRNCERFGHALTVAALSYIPLCLYEMRMSPQIHRIVYGFSGRTGFSYSHGFGPLGWQPAVFMNSVFEIALLFVMATLFAFALWRSSKVITVLGVPVQYVLSILGAFVLMSKKLTGIGLLLASLAVLWSRWIGFQLLVIAFPIVYVTLFTLGLWRGRGLSDAVEIISKERASSLQYRLDMDERLVKKAMQQPIFGWGGWGRNRVYDDGRDTSVTDSDFLITLGTRGLFGLIPQMTLFLGPPIIFLMRSLRMNRRCRISIVFEVMTTILVIHAIDNLFNAFPNSIYPLLSGSIGAILASGISLDQQIDLIYVEDV